MAQRPHSEARVPVEAEAAGSPRQALGRSDVLVREHWIGTPQGRLFARSWQPGTHGRQARPTILLLHDSLGCIELWRDFPMRLVRATRLPVLAYDRLGFGRSDPHPGVLPLHFIREEAETTVPALLGQLGLGTLVPLGHSVGGGMALAIAAHWPERCAATVTIAAQAFVEGADSGGHPLRPGGLRRSGSVRASVPLPWRQGPLGARRMDRDLARAGL